MLIAKCQLPCEAIYNPTVLLKIDKLVYGGEGLARRPADDHGPGKSVFVPFVLPGETVEAAPFEEKRGFARASLDRVIEASPARIPPDCPYFQRCGGCHYQHTNYATQVESKATILKETLKRTGKLDLPCELTIHPSPEWNYRNRTRLKVQTVPEFAFGYYRFRSHELLPVEQCPISSPLINRAIAAGWSAGRAGRMSAALRELEFFADSNGEQLLLEAYCTPGAPRQEARRLAETLASIMPEIAGVMAFEQATSNQPNDPTVLAEFGQTQLTYRTPSFSYRVSAGSFFQVNRCLIDELAKLVTGDRHGKLALDLYAGVGLFSCLLARSFAQVISVEASQTSYSDLRQNAPQEVKAVRATTEQYLARASGQRPDFVVVDPPRGGLGENVARNLARLGSPRITYVSCDPSTLARDLRVLLGLGYRIEGAHLIDLFPQTYHIESVFHLAR